ncbi:hypothetical protein EUGRSUZ_G00418 [Eucalyptus grandis]|uniref:Disease resistance protein At4g27190-like leucine-rich repeats domain-containing protein n=3 Tax=Eucalyptus grandis TaxID=71139 RepID=A0A059BA97_EUCGR|nr:hypothetical protein EUGRSUZ_G00418 [Eucalyptus grandis]KAK3419737.1 hypothetical protein EUGRSUZ_G00418 [Eucalyptus grandis]
MVGLLGPEETLYSERSLKYSNLRVLTIRESKSWSKNVEILSRLTNLTLERLPNLQCVCKQDVKLQGISILRNLRDLYIYETGLSFLFSVSVAKCLREIRTITVSGCPNMKAVIMDEGRNEGTYDIIEFPLLDYLSIDKCWMGKFFRYPCEKKELVTTTSYPQDAYSDSFFDQKVTFPNITKLKIDGIECKELWNNQIPTNSFQKLESLELRNCDSLQRIATSDMWKKLQRCLKKLEVISCRSIQIIYEGNGMDIETSELRRLVLRNLRNLWCIWPYDSLPNIPFPNLREVEAERCPCLEVLLPTFTAKFLGQIKDLVVESCENMKLIASHEKWEEANGTTITFSELTVLRLFELPKFKSFLPEKYSLKFPCSKDFPSLRVLSIESCGSKPDQVLGVWPRPYFLPHECHGNEDSACHII